MLGIIILILLAFKRRVILYARLDAHALRLSKGIIQIFVDTFQVMCPTVHIVFIFAINRRRFMCYNVLTSS